MASSKQSKKNAGANSRKKGKTDRNVHLSWAHLFGVLVTAVLSLTIATQKGKIMKMLDFKKTPVSKMFTREELKMHDGSDTTLPTYLAILGQVFDVSSAPQHYGPDGGYAFFSGIDGTAAFLTGEFNEKGLHDDVSVVKTNSLPDLQDWQDMYHKDYKFVGYLIGRFYDSNGQPTSDLEKYRKRLEVAMEQRRQLAELRKTFPSCNSRSGGDTPPEVWCAQGSGGVQREWVGVPRLFLAEGTDMKRCACVKYEIAQSDTRFTIYEGCDPKSSRCFTAVK